MHELPRPEPVVKEREKIGKFDLQPTDLPGISLQVEKGAEVEMSETDREARQKPHGIN